MTRERRRWRGGVSTVLLTMKLPPPTFAPTTGCAPRFKVFAVIVPPPVAPPEARPRLIVSAVRVTKLPVKSAAAESVVVPVLPAPSPTLKSETRLELKPANMTDG